MVDAVISTLDSALAKQGITTKAVERWKAEMPTEQEMVPKDKYTMFDRKEKRYRKGVHSEWTFWIVLGAIAGLKGEWQVLSMGLIGVRNRATKVDESQPESESSRFLGIEG